MISMKSRPLVILSFIMLSFSGTMVPASTGLVEEGSGKGLMAPVGPDTYQLTPTLTLSPLDPASQSVNVTEREGAEASYTSVVTVTKPPLVTATVNLDGSCGLGFPVTVVPDTITFTESGEATVEVTVVVPEGSIAMEGITVQLNAVMTYPGGTNTATSTGTLNVDPYFGARISVKKVTSGNPMEYDVTITNIGNVNDTFDIDIQDRSDLEADGFDFDLAKTRTEKLELGFNETIRLEVSYGVSTPSGERDITLRGLSLGSKEAEDVERVYSHGNFTINVSPLGGGGSQTYLLVGGMGLVIAIVVAVFILRGRRKKAGSRRGGGTGKRTGKAGTGKRTGKAGTGKRTGKAGPGKRTGKGTGPGKRTGKGTGPGKREEE